MRYSSSRHGCSTRPSSSCLPGGQPAAFSRTTSSLSSPPISQARFGLIVTSPPYPNAYEYWLYHKFRMHWLGEDPLAVRRTRDRARGRTTSRKTRPRRTTSAAKWRSVSGCSERSPSPGAIACVVIGRSIIHGEVIDNAALLRAAGRPHGFNMIASAERTIPRTRKAFNPSYGNIATEHILVFQRN